MKIGYVRLGRSFQLNPAEWTGVGGDADAWRLLDRLARALPEAEIRVVGRNTGENPQAVGLPANVTNPWTSEAWQRGAGIVSNVREAKEQQLVMFQALSVQDLLFKPAWDDLTHIIVWMGQHGTSNWPIPVTGKSKSELQADNGLTKPQVSFFNYCAYVIDQTNQWVDADPTVRADRVIALCPDPRNYQKARDFKWPMREILAQYDESRKVKHERHGDTRAPAELGFPDFEWSTEPDSAWEGSFDHVYSALELTALPEPSQVRTSFGDDRDGVMRYPFGMIVNENRPYVANSRLQGLQEFVFPWTTDFPIFGRWCDKSLAELKNVGIEEVKEVAYTEMFDVLGTFMSTLMLPASGSRWATAKPWECFARGVVCFMHPLYDAQGHILARRPKLQEFLRVQDAAELEAKVNRLKAEPGLFNKVIVQQRLHYEEIFAEEQGGARAVLARLEEKVEIPAEPAAFNTGSFGGAGQMPVRIG